MKTIDQLMAEFYEAFKGCNMPPVDGTIRGMLWDAWQSGKREERTEVVEQLSSLLLRRTIDEDHRAEEALTLATRREMF